MGQLWVVKGLFEVSREEQGREAPSCSRGREKVWGLWRAGEGFRAGNTAAPKGRAGGTGRQKRLEKREKQHSQSLVVREFNCCHSSRHCSGKGGH